MTGKDQDDRTKLTFSQRAGLEPLPDALKLEELSDQARALLWKFIYEDLQRVERRSSGYSGPSQLGEPWRSILYDWHVRREHRPADEFYVTHHDNIEHVKSIINTKPFNVVFDFLEFVMRHRSCLRNIKPFVRYCFEQSLVAYTVVDDGPTIMPAATPEEGAAIQTALHVAADAGLDGARAHLMKSGEELNEGNFADSVRESIHAVESVAKKLSKKADTALSPALGALSKKVPIHADLMTGFKKIYGYTSDEKGVRHALLEGKANVDREDAVFMLGACASFVTYLIGKARGSGLIKT